jgi:hypothetical protein
LATALGRPTEDLGLGYGYDEVTVWSGHVHGAGQCPVHGSGACRSGADEAVEVQRVAA